MEIRKDIYIHSVLEDGTAISHIEFLMDNVIVENNKGEELNFNYSDKLQVRIFKKIEIVSLNDFIIFSKNPNVYITTNEDCNLDSAFNTFSDESFVELLKEEDFHIDELEGIINSCWGILKSTEKQITFSELSYICDDVG